MRLYISIIAFTIITAAIVSFYFKPLKGEEVSYKSILAEHPSQESIDTTPRITGIGGIFFHSKNPTQTSVWYQKNLGVKTDQYGAVFEFRNALNPKEKNYLRWSPSNDPTHTGLTDQLFMVNYRVQNLAGLVRKLKSSGVIIKDTVETYEYGKFIHIIDIDGRKIELWEPVDSILTKLGGETNK